MQCFFVEKNKMRSEKRYIIYIVLGKTIKMTVSLMIFNLELHT